MCPIGPPHAPGRIPTGAPRIIGCTLQLAAQPGGSMPGPHIMPIRGIPLKQAGPRPICPIATIGCALRAPAGRCGPACGAT
eukprot:scaffold1567_cov106-Isochrysis_galbana.AAC.9